MPTKYWGVAKLVKARDFDSRMRRFESYRPSHFEQGLKRPLFVQSRDGLPASGHLRVRSFSSSIRLVPKERVGGSEQAPSDPR